MAAVERAKILSTSFGGIKEIPADPSPQEDHPVFEAGPDDLFNEEQKRQGNRPWWKLNLFINEPVLFGTWDGVFTSVLINTFGIIVFLRSGWTVANAGIGESVLILILCTLLVLLPVLSAIGICERCQIQGGGVYFLISHILGGQIGGAVGLVYALGQAVAGSLVAVGFAETVAVLLKIENAWAIRGVAVAVTLVLVGINMAGVKWVIKVQLVLLVLLLLSVFDFLIGSFVTYKLDEGIVGYSSELFQNNTGPDYSKNENFFTVFGVYFSTFTGVLSGVNMSGDLKDPKKSIPLGELTALLANAVLSLLFLLALGGTCQRWALLSDPMIAEKISWVAILFMGGLYVSSLSCILGSLYSAPRVLQCIAADNVIPFMKLLDKGHGPNKVPLMGIGVITLVIFLFILIADLNMLAKIATVPYLITYGFINYAYVSLAMTFDLQQQRATKFPPSGLPKYGSMDKLKAASNNEDLKKLFPERAHYLETQNDDEDVIYDKTGLEQPMIINQPKSWYAFIGNRWVALIGVVVNLVIVFLVNWAFALAHYIAIIVIHFYIGWTNPGAFPGISEFSIPHCVKTIFGNFKKSPDKRDHFVVAPSNPAIDTEQTRLNEENDDFSTRDQFHQSTTSELLKDDFD